MLHVKLKLYGVYNCTHYNKLKSQFELFLHNHWSFFFPKVKCEYVLPHAVLINLDKHLVIFSGARKHYDEDHVEINHQPALVSYYDHTCLHEVEVYLPLYPIKASE